MSYIWNPFTEQLDYFQSGGNNATGSGITNARLSAGTLSSYRSDITFGDSNGVSFGLDTNGVLTGTVATNYQPAGAYLTTAALSGDTTKYAGVGESIGTVSGTDLGLTVNTDGVSILYPKWLTAASGGGGTGFTTTAVAGTAVAGTNDTNGLKLAVPAFLTTYVNDLTSGRAGVGTSLSTTGGTDPVMTLDTNGLFFRYPKAITTYVNDLTSGRAGLSTGTQTTAGVAIVMTHDTNGLNLGVPAYITTYVNDLTSQRAGTSSGTQTTAGTNVLMTINTAGLNLGVPAYLTTYVNDLTSQRAGTGTSLGTTAGSDPVMTLNTNGLSLLYPKWLTVAAGGGNTISHYENFNMSDNVASNSMSLNQLNLQPFILQEAVSFGQVNLLLQNSSTNNSTFFSLTVSRAASGGGASLSAGYSMTNSEYIDMYLFSRGTGGYSSDIATFASTRNSFCVAWQNNLFVTDTNSSTNSHRLTMLTSIFRTVTFPMMTSGTMTSVNANTTVTTWGAGYGSTTDSTSSSYAALQWSTSATSSTAPSAIWFTNYYDYQGYVLCPFKFATSLSAGEYWLGLARSSSISVSTSSATAGSTSCKFTTAGTYDTYSAVMPYIAGGTNTVSVFGSLKWLGSNRVNSIGVLPGHGTFTATFNPALTYVNNAGQPAGEIALSNIKIDTLGSCLNTWFQLASKRI